MSEINLTAIEITVKENKVICLNSFYESISGKLGKVIYIDKLKIKYILSLDGEAIEVPFDEFYFWLRRKDISDWPNSDIPKLPYDFDLRHPIYVRLKRGYKSRNR